MRETRASAPASILPRLDIQSEDEDEVDQSLIYQPQSPKLQNWSKIMSPKIVIPKEARTIVAVSLVLLVLLLIATKAVDSLNSDRTMNDAVIMVLAYLLTPIRSEMATIFSFKLKTDKLNINQSYLLPTIYSLFTSF